MATNEKRVNQHGTIQHVRLGSMATPPHAQRESFDPRRVAQIVAEFNLDVFGLPVVSERRGVYYILDGVHRIEAIKQWLGDGWKDQKIECRVLVNLTESDEADMFDRLNNAKPVSAFDKFRVRVNANRDTEVAVKHAVEAEGLVIARGKIQGAIGSVTTLCKVYTRSNEQTLRKALRLTRDAWGDAGFESHVIDGMGAFVQRYDGLIDEETAAVKLGAVHGGVKGLLNKAAKLHEQTGATRPHCVAAAAVDIINSSKVIKGGKKLPSWWKSHDNKEETA